MLGFIIIVSYILIGIINIFYIAFVKLVSDGKYTPLTRANYLRSLAGTLNGDDILLSIVLWPILFVMGMVFIIIGLLDRCNFSSKLYEKANELEKNNKIKEK